MPFVAVVDFETTGLRPTEGHTLVEIGRCDLISVPDLFGLPDWGQGEIGDPMSIVVDPGRSIPPETSAIHHLIDEDCRGLMPWREAIEMLRTGPGVTAYAAHSASMEQQWLTPDLTGETPWVCTFKCALRAWTEAPGHSNQTLRYWLRPVGLNRAKAMPAHRAGPDAYVTSFTLRELLRLHPLHRLIEWSSEPALLVRVPFGKPPAEGGSRGMRWTEVDDSLLHWVACRDFSEDILHTVRIEMARREKAEAVSVGDDH